MNLAVHGGSAAVRLVACFEAAKGGLVVLTGAALLEIGHLGAQRTAERMVRHLHLNPANRYPRIFVDAAANLTDARLRLLAIAATTYAIARFAEAYGLWRGRAWARFFGIATGGIYIPFEIWNLTRRVTPIGIGALAVNVLVVIVLVLWFHRDESMAQSIKSRGAK